MGITDVACLTVGTALPTVTITSLAAHQEVCSAARQVVRVRPRLWRGSDASLAAFDCRVSHRHLASASAADG